MAWTTSDDVLRAWIGDDSPSDTSLIDTWIDKAERLVRFHVPDISARLALDEGDLQDTVIDVVAAMVIRKFRNPEGVRQENVTTGPFTESRTYGGDAPGELTLTADDIDRLTGKQKSGQQAFSISMIPTSSVFHPSYNWWPFDVG